MVLLFSGCCFFLPVSLSAGSAELYYSDVRHYRDSLLRRISTTGSVEMSCYLSYPIGSSRVDPSFGNNPLELSALGRFLHLSLGDTLLVVRQVSLTGYCSPDGAEGFNERLSRDRARRLCDYLRQDDPFFRLYPVDVSWQGADWQGLRGLLSESVYPWGGEAARIIDSDEPYERKKLYLTALDSGRAHEVIYNLYPLLRRVEVKISYDVVAMRAKGFVAPPEVDAGLLSGEVPVAKPVFPHEPGPSYCDTLIYVIEKPAVFQKRHRPHEKQQPGPFRAVNPLFALKTNLLFDAVLAPNVELEVPLGNRWSVLAEYTFPWWLSRTDEWCYEMLQVGLEGRYWLGDRSYTKNGSPRNLLTGWFVGVYTGAGYYDFQLNRNEGYQGEFYIAAGAGGGYACRLSRRLNMEFSVGLGALSTKYRKYEVVRGADKTELGRQSYGKLFWVGPTKAKVSLVWLLGNRKGGRR